MVAILQKKIEISQYLSIGLTDQHEILHNDAYWPSEPYAQLQIPVFTIQDGGWPPFWKNC